eukprot:s679_g24.t2
MPLSNICWAVAILLCGRAALAMQVKVVLPSGEVNVPVEPNSTPGHLKENLKYSIRAPPKQIKLTCEGRELDDIKPLAGEPNNVADGAVLVAERREGVVEDESFSPKSSPPPAMIRKEEPPKPKKPKKDVVRPTLSEGDVKKEKTLSPGHQGWAVKSAYLEAKSKKRHMAYLKIENCEEKKAYPEHEDFSVVLPLGDPQCSPVWTAVVQQLEIGERASFTLSRKVLDFNPESLAPDDFCSTWEVELIRVAEVEDVAEDFQQLLEIESRACAGSFVLGEDLDAAAVHWRVRRWMPEGTFCIASSRERIAILPGYGLVPIEDQNAPPVQVAVGEGQQEAVELIAGRVGPGGKGHLFLKSQALKANRPNGCVIMDVELAEGAMNTSSLLQEGRALTLSVVGPFLAGAAGVGLLWQFVCVAKHLHRTVRLVPRESQGSSLTTTQRSSELGKASMGYRAYETQTAVNEYLHFHYGPQSVQLQMAVQGASQVTWGFERVLDVCFNHAVGWEHALDVGCAVGGNTFALSSRFQHVVGVDTSHAFIQAACSLQRTKSLPYMLPGRSRFDLILACNVLCRLRTPRSWLSSLREALSSDGVVVLATPYAWLEAWTPAEEWMGQCGEESSKALTSFMQQLGFRELHREEVAFVLAQNERIHELFVSELTAWKLDIDVVVRPMAKDRRTKGWKGWQSLIQERETGDSWLDEADGRRKQLETFGTLRKSTEDEVIVQCELRMLPAVLAKPGSVPDFRDPGSSDPDAGAGSPPSGTLATIANLHESSASP